MKGTKGMVSELCTTGTGARIAEGLARKRAQLQVYSKIPYGFDRSGNYLVPNAEELNVIHQMRGWRSDGWSFQRIVNELMDQDIPTKTGAEWHPTTIRYLLKNPLYGPTLTTRMEGGTLALTLEAADTTDGSHSEATPMQLVLDPTPPTDFSGSFYSGPLKPALPTP